MNASEQLPKGAAQSQGDVDGTATSTAPGTCRIGSVMSGLEKALDALFKAQDHLNTAADRGGDGVSKMLDGINHSLRGLERELSQLIYRLGNSR